MQLFRLAGHLSAYAPTAPPKNCMTMNLRAYKACIIVVTHGQEICASFLEQLDLPEILRNIALPLADYLLANCRKTCASLSCRMTCRIEQCSSRARKRASFRARDAIAIA